MFQFSCRFAFLSTVRTPKITRILSVSSKRTLTPLSKEDNEDKPQSHRTVRKISREAGDPSIISFADYSQRSVSQVLQEKERSTAD